MHCCIHLRIVLCAHALLSLTFDNINVAVSYWRQLRFSFFKLVNACCASPGAIRVLWIDDNWEQSLGYWGSENIRSLLITNISLLCGVPVRAVMRFPCGAPVRAVMRISCFVVFLCDKYWDYEISCLAQRPDTDMLPNSQSDVGMLK